MNFVSCRTQEQVTRSNHAAANHDALKVQEIDQIRAEHSQVTPGFVEYLLRALIALQRRVVDGSRAGDVSGHAHFLSSLYDAGTGNPGLDTSRGAAVTRASSGLHHRVAKFPCVPRCTPEKSAGKNKATAQPGTESDVSHMLQTFPGSASPLGNRPGIGVILCDYRNA